MVLSKMTAIYIAEPSKDNPNDFSMQKVMEAVKAIHGDDKLITSEMISTGSNIAFKYVVYEKIEQ